MAIKQAQATLYNSFRALVVDKTAAAALTVTTQLNFTGGKTRYGAAGLRVQSTEIVNSRLTTLGGSSAMATTTRLTCKLPTYYRFDMDLVAGIPEATNVIIHVEDGFVVEGDYANSTRQPLTGQLNFMQFRTPKKFRANTVSQCAVTANNARFRNSSANLLAQGLFEITAKVQIVRDITTDEIVTVLACQASKITNFSADLFSGSTVAAAITYTTRPQIDLPTNALITIDATRIEQQYNLVMTSGVNSQGTYAPGRLAADITANCSLSCQILRLKSLSSDIAAESTFTATGIRPLVDYIPAGPSGNTGVTISVTGAYITVNWGDSTESTYTNFDGNITKTYLNNNSRTITIRGNVSNLGSLTANSNLLAVDRLSLGDITVQTLRGYGSGFSNRMPQRLPPNITNLEQCFRGGTGSKSGIAGWNTSAVTNMSECFELFNGTGAGGITNWNTSAVTNMQEMFAYSIFSEGWPVISNWNTSAVTNMSQMFRASDPNQSLSNWNTSSVTDMSLMFRDSAFTNNIGLWNVSNVTNMSGMFSGSQFNNSTLNNWNVSNVTDMSSMFSNSQFNQNITGWNVSKVTDMELMFANNYNFNQNISTWNVSAVQDFSSMFQGASAFNQNLSAWNWDLTPSTLSMFFGIFWNANDGTPCGMSQQNLDRTIIGWANRVANNFDTTDNMALGLPTGYSASVVNYGGSPYNNASAALAFLDVNKEWIVTYS